MVVLFFAFAGWEAVAHLIGEFSDPDRDVPRAVMATIAVVTVLYLGIAAAVVFTGTFGNPHVDHVAIGLLLQDRFGTNASVMRHSARSSVLEPPTPSSLVSRG